MKRIYAFVDDSVLPEVKTVLKDLMSRKSLKIDAFHFSDKQALEPNYLTDAECFLIFFGESPQSVNTACRLAQYCKEQHLKLIPVFSGARFDYQNISEILSSRHILLFSDPSITGKILYSLNIQTTEIEPFFHSVQQTRKKWENGDKASLTAQQLFDYAVGLLYGIESYVDYNLSFRIQMCLVGNEAFDPSMIQLGVIPTKSVDVRIAMDYAETLKQYIDFELQRIEQTADFEHTEKLLEYGYLLKNLGSSLLYGLHVDEVLQNLNRIAVTKCKNDSSVIACLWLQRYYWAAAERDARNRYFEKMLDNLLEILFLGDRVLVKHDDFQIKRYMFQAASILGMYNSLRPNIITSVINFKVLDEYQDTNTFRPRHKTEPRAEKACRIMRNLQKKYAWNKNISVDSFFSESDISSKRNKLAKAISDTVDLFLFCKCNCVSDVLPVWFQINLKILADSVPMKNQGVHLNLLSQYSTFLQNLINAPYASSSEALLYAALHMEAFYDRCASECEKLGLDKSEIYSVLTEVYAEMNDYEKHDFYQIKLFEIVSVRDHGNPDVITRMLIQCYNMAVERMEQSLYEQVKMYICFGWDCCRTYDPMPEWMSTAYDRFQSAAADLEL